MLVKKKFRFSIAILIMTAPLVANADGLNRFNYGEIPFGEPVSAVLETVEGADITETSSPSLRVVFQYRGVSEYFQGGIYQSFGRLGYLPSDVVTQYQIRADEWEGEIRRINLYFTAPHDTDEEPVLFAVHKRLDDMQTKGAYSSVVSEIRDSVSDAVGSDPDTAVRTVYQERDGGRLDAERSSWETDKLHVLLLTVESPFMNAVGDLDFVYIHKDLWQGYLDAVNDWEAYREKEDREAASESADNF